MPLRRARLDAGLHDLVLDGQAVRQADGILANGAVPFREQRCGAKFNRDGSATHVRGLETLAIVDYLQSLCQRGGQFVWHAFCTPPCRGALPVSKGTNAM